MTILDKPMELYSVTFPNDKKYIGITAKGIEGRIRAHYDASKRIDNKFYRALKKYGAENVDITVLATNLTKEEAILLEKAFIEEFDTKTNGYNSTEGGEGVSGLKYTDEIRKNISEAQKKRFSKEDERENTRLKTKEWIDNNPDKVEEINKKRNKVTKTKEHSDKMSGIMKDFYSKNPDICKKQGETMSLKYASDPELGARISKSLGGGPIEVLVEGSVVGTYPSICACARDLNLSTGNIGMVLKGTRTHTGGYTFKRE